MDITWTVSNGGGTSVPPSPQKKLAYISKQRKKDDMSEAQKRGIDQWNAMVDKLKENGLMEDA